MLQDEQGRSPGKVLHLLLDRSGRLRVPFPGRIASEVMPHYPPDHGSGLGHALELGFTHTPPPPV